MASKAQAEIYSIEHLQKIYRTKPSIHAGAMALAGWVSGKEVSDVEYRGAISRFLVHPKEGKNA